MGPSQRQNRHPENPCSPNPHRPLEDAVSSARKSQLSAGMYVSGLRTQMEAVGPLLCGVLTWCHST